MIANLLSNDSNRKRPAVATTMRAHVKYLKNYETFPNDDTWPKKPIESILMANRIKIVTHGFWIRIRHRIQNL